MNEVLDESATKDRHLNSYRVARSEQLKALVRSIVAQLEAYEVSLKLRARARKPNDQKVFERQVECLVCEALLCHLVQPKGWVTVSRSKRILGHASRYQSPVMGRTLPDVMDLLTSPEMGLLDVTMGIVNPFNGCNVQTTLRASGRLLGLAAELNLTHADFGRDDAEEVIILKAEKQRGKSARFPYADDEQTAALRAEVKTINAWLAQAEIELADDFPGKSTDDRKMTRSFNNGTFAHGGRLSGGFWQGMTKAQRKSILIDGCETVTLDYKQMGPSIHYGLAGIPFSGDAYAVPGYEFHRAGIKKVFGAMTHARRRFNRLEDLDPLALPAGVKLSKACQDIERHHALIADRFYCRSGMEAMRTESDVIVGVMLELRARGIVGLPIHDAVLVREDQADQVDEVMRALFTQHTGNTVAVSME
ncbi:hypothetical protein [Paraburkholderia sp. J94]|uniref:hypothetical protein n=1 Tax=Paraburkholderia sp. J94 TaxID=2805441 RepID=UPI002AB15FCA|nr:hypothetical protein [Paraburkholderia sp. J94]